MVQNPDDVDAVVVLEESAENRRGFYIRAGDQLTVPNVAAGTYRVRIALGHDWSTDHFTSDASFQEVEQPISFVERDIGDELEHTQLTLTVEAETREGIRLSAPFRVAGN